MHNSSNRKQTIGNRCTNDAPRNSRNHRMPLPKISVGAGPTAAENREVTRCLLCGLVQYRPKKNFCRKCLRFLPCTITFRIPAPPEAVEEAASASQHDLVKNIGHHIQQLRESRKLSQSDLQHASSVSRSYLSRIESGAMTPSLGTLEKIGSALGIGLHRFFIPETSGEALAEDSFIQDLRPFLRRLDYDRWQFVLRRLVAISGDVDAKAKLGAPRKSA